MVWVKVEQLHNILGERDCFKIASRCFGQKVLFYWSQTWIIGSISWL